MDASLAHSKSFHDDDVKTSEGMAEATVLEAQGDTLVKPHWFRSVWFQIWITGIVAASGPSMFDAMGALGGGGLATPYVANASSCILYSMLFLFCIFGGPIINYLGLGVSLVIGSIGFPLYGAALYCNSAYGTQWFLIFGATLTGISSALWFVAESSIILSYPPEHMRGRMIGVWVGFRDAGSIIGGSMLLALNVNSTTAGKISVNTYLIFVGLMCIGFPVAWLFSDPAKVRRSDGTSIDYRREKLGIKQELRELAKIFKMRRTLLLLPFFFTSYFYLGQVGTFNTKYFSVRSRSLTSLVNALSGIITSFLFGCLMDSKFLSRSKRARYGFALIWILQFVGFIWWTVVQYDYIQNPPKGLDWSQPGWARGFLIRIWVGSCGQMSQNAIYWLLSCFARNTQDMARQGGVFRGVEAAGQAIAYGINSKALTPWIGLGIIIGVSAFGVIPSWLVVLDVEDELPDQKAEED